MTEQLADSAADELDLDTKVLSQVVFALNIARRQVATYPPDHPAITPTLTRFLQALQVLLEFQSEVTIGVARDTLMVGAGLLDRKNAVYRDLAGKLFAADIAAVRFHRDLTAGELQAFLAALCRDPAELHRDGGLARILVGRNVRHLVVQPIDYAAFATTEVEAVSAADSAAEQDRAELLWIRFIDGLLASEPSPQVPSAAHPAELLPDQLAELVNRRQRGPATSSGNEYDRAITHYLQQLDREELNQRARTDAFVKLSHFIRRLEPGIRRQFLHSTFRGLSERHDLASEVCGALSGDTLLELLNDVDDPQLSVPPVIVNLLGKFAEHRDADPARRQVAARQDFNDEQLRQRLQTLFRKDHSDRFLCHDYQAFLQTTLQDPPRLTLAPHQLEALTASMNGHQLESRFCAIILELVDADPLCDDAEVLISNLVELIRYFLETGDFPALVATHRRLARHFNESEPFSVPLAREALAAYAAPDFVAEMLQGLASWGRAKHDEIRALIRCVGKPCVEPLLDRLAQEKSMVLRQCYLACLKDLGPASRDGVIGRLRDKRWYVVRNMVLLLRRLNDRSVLPAIGYLFSHPQPQVQREVLQTYLHYGEPRAVRYLLKELAQDDQRRRMTAVLLARCCHAEEVVQRLLAMLEDRLSEESFGLQRAVLRSLADIGDPQVLPQLEERLRRTHLLHPILHRRLKIELLRTLPRYPGGSERLRRLTAGGNGELARLAAQQLRRAPRRGP